MRGVLCKYNRNVEKPKGDHGQPHIYCAKQLKWVPIYQCKKGLCQYHEFETVTVVSMKIGRCDECPYNKIQHTPNTGYGEDYICKLTGKISSGYVEWDNEINPVPDWCPFRALQEDVVDVNGTRFSGTSAEEPTYPENENDSGNFGGEILIGEPND